MKVGGMPSRRSIIGALLRGLGVAALWPSLRQASAAGAPGEEKGPLTVRVQRPFDAETPVSEFSSFLTPTHRLFVRSHFGPPPVEMVTEPQWKLHVGGLVKESRDFSLKALRDLEAVTVTSILQCSGNGRAFHRPKVPGVQWERGAVANVQWRGARLRDVLTAVGVKATARHVQFLGADRPVKTSVPLFKRSIPLDKALHPDTILAYEMNGRPLPLLHGAPLRVVTPGWMAESCIKWLTDIMVQENEAQGYYMQTAYRMPITAIQSNSGLPGTTMAPVEAMVVKSLIVAPAEGANVGPGPVTIQGVAWSGESPVKKVEVSLDRGKTWEAARLVGEDLPYAWRQWQLIWRPKTPGPVSLLCRATDANGDEQPETTEWNPGGFLWNGWDRVNVTVTA